MYVKRIIFRIARFYFVLFLICRRVSVSVCVCVYLANEQVREKSVCALVFIPDKSKSFLSLNLNVINHKNRSLSICCKLIHTSDKRGTHEQQQHNKKYNNTSGKLHCNKRPLPSVNTSFRLFESFVNLSVDMTENRSIWYIFKWNFTFFFGVVDFRFFCFFKHWTRKSQILRLQ